METSLKAGVAAVVAVFLIGNAPVASFGQCPCILVCPAGDGGPVVSAGGGTKSPDLDGNGRVDILDLARFAAAWPPNPYLFCADYDCNGMINIVDLAMFAVHWTHAGPIRGYNQPAVDHYKVYEALAVASVTGPIWLKDQFGEDVVTFLQLRRSATPVSKNGQAICDSVAHQVWWEFLAASPPYMVRAQDQFGTHDWMLGVGSGLQYLLTPALKNPASGDELPVLNHYRCYEAQGPTMTMTVTLVDQFDTTTVMVLEGKYFCNPCEKQIPDVGAYPIVDPIAHLTCYVVQNPVQYSIQVRMRDQFVEFPVVLEGNSLLCLPALKLDVFGPDSSEWHRIRALYE